MIPVGWSVYRSYADDEERRDLVYEGFERKPKRWNLIFEIRKGTAA